MAGFPKSYVTDPAGGVGVGVGVEEGAGVGVEVGLMVSTPPPPIDGPAASASQFTAPDKVQAHVALLYPEGVQLDSEESGQILLRDEDLLT